jgi:hypothetical protein
MRGGNVRRPHVAKQMCCYAMCETFDATLECELLAFQHFKTQALSRVDP